ncbi:MAG: hypothetical protein ACR2HF_06785, partial [Methylococcaceae bacterium]
MNLEDTQLPLAFLDKLPRLSTKTENPWLNILERKDAQLAKLHLDIEEISSRLEHSEKEYRRLKHILVQHRIIIPKNPLIDDRYQISDDGAEVQDISTGLIWRRRIESGRFEYREAFLHTEKMVVITGQTWR